MLKCVNGHQTTSFTKCERCGQQADLEKSLDTLSDIPEFQAPWTDTMILTVGLPSPIEANAWHLQVKPAESPQETEQEFTFKSVSGETWHDIATENQQRFQQWLTNTGFYQAKYKFIITDTTNPSAVLPILSLKNSENLAIFALTADAQANSLEQNTSYVALDYIKKKKMPLINCPKSLLENLTSCIEDNLTVNTDTLNVVTTFLIGFLRDLIDIMNRDSKLGVWSHTFTACFSASDLVYSNPSVALSMQQETFGSLKREDIHTAYLFGRADQNQQEVLRKAFGKQFSDKKARLLNKGVTFSDKQSTYRLYDLLLLLGVKELNLTDIETGYNLVASRNADLGVKADEN